MAAIHKPCIFSSEPNWTLRIGIDGMLLYFLPKGIASKAQGCASQTWESKQKDFSTLKGLRRACFMFSISKA
jgi:hypothetical protein